MSDFEEKNAEEKTEVAEEGWTAVKGKGTTRRTEEEQNEMKAKAAKKSCLLYTSPSPRDRG